MRGLQTPQIQRLRVLTIVAVLAFAAGSALVAYATDPVTFYACRNVRLNFCAIHPWVQGAIKVR